MLTSETKQKINNCRDILVGKVPDPKWQIDQITNALIYKFMADQDFLSLDIGWKASFFIEDYQKYSWKKLFDTKLNHIERADLYIKWLENLSKAKHLPELFRDIFKDAYLPFKDANTIVLFLTEINKFDYHHTEELWNAFEYLLSIMWSQWNAGQFRTPRHIIEFLVDVVDPKLGQTIYDPACGTAWFLISAYTHILENNPDLSVVEKLELYKNISWVDIDPGMAKIARVNLYLHWFKTPKITEDDTLSNPKLWENKFDIILANPPFMTPNGGVKAHEKYTIKSTKAEILFTDFIAEHLKLKWKAWIIVPDWVISSANSWEYSQLRKKLIENYLWWVISLPAWIFEPYSKVKTWILLLDRELNKKIDEIIFIDIINDGFSLDSLRKEVSDNTIPTALNILNDWKNKWIKNLTNISTWVWKKKILSNNKVYLTHWRFKNNDDIVSKEWYVKIWDLIEPSNSWKVWTLKNIPVMSITMENWLIDQSEKFKKRIANKDISKYKLVKKNELVVWFPIDEWVLWFQKKYDLAAVSPAYWIWKLKKGVNIEALELILRSIDARKIYLKYMKWTANRRRIVPNDLFIDIYIPDPDSSNMKKIVALLKHKEDLEKKLKHIKNKIYTNINYVWEENSLDDNI